MSNLRTRAERTGYLETSTHADVLAFIEELQPRGRGRLTVTSFGNTPEGRSLPLLVLSARGVSTPREAHAAGLPIVLIQCGIHAGEVEGKEASLMLARDLLSDRYPGLLERLVVLIVPLFNADGNDRIEPANRRLDIEHFSGQLGPQSVGTRENAAGINLNRDYMRLDGAEMRLMQTRICHPWNPHFTIDCHTTNGSIHRFDMTYDIPHTVDSGRREPIEFMRQQLMPAVNAAVKATEGIDSFWYGNFQRDEGGEGTGWITYPHHPRFGGNYRGLTNRLDLLLETYSYIDFPARVRATYSFLRETLKLVASRADTILDLLASSLLPPDSIAVNYALESFDTPVTILTREPYTLDGAPVTASVPHIARFVGIAPVTRPFAYAVPDRVAQHLRAHGLTVESHRPTKVDAEIATAQRRIEVKGRGILEASSSSHWQFDSRREARDLPAGWQLVHTRQQRGAIAAYLCEPGSDDGLDACGLLGDLKPGDEFPAWRVLAS